MRGIIASFSFLLSSLRYPHFRHCRSNRRPWQWNYIGQVYAVPNEIAEIKKEQEETKKNQKILMEQNVQIGSYIKAIEEEKQQKLDRKKNAPPGWMWSEESEKYIPDPDYVPPKKVHHGV